MITTGYLWLVYQVEDCCRNLCARVNDCVRLSVVCGFYSSFILLVSPYTNVLIDKLLWKWQESCSFSAVVSSVVPTHWCVTQAKYGAPSGSFYQHSVHRNHSSTLASLGFTWVRVGEASETVHIPIACGDNQQVWVFKVWELSVKSWDLSAQKMLNSW